MGWQTFYDKDGKHVVYTDTSSEYTGFNATNGSYIFEGDILQFRYKKAGKGRSLDYATTWLVAWSESNGEWMLLGDKGRIGSLGRNVCPPCADEIVILGTASITLS